MRQEAYSRDEVMQNEISDL